MNDSRLMHWILCCVVALAGVAGCSTDTTSGEATGSLNLNLVLAGGVEIDVVDWEITGNGMDMGGSIDVSAPGSTASIEVFGLPKGDDEDYTITLEATSVDGEVTCKGSEEFNVEPGETENVMVILNCKLPQRLGAVRVNGKFNICAELVKAVVSPLQTSVGNDIDLFAQGMDRDGDDIHYRWTGTGGSIDDENAASTTYTCQEAGDHFVNISVTDNDEYCNMAEWTISVACVPGEAECQSDLDCEAGEVCVAGQCVPDVGCNTDADCEVGEICVDNDCVPDVDCMMDSECDDENQCTVDICTAGECSNPNQDADVTCDQNGGSVCDGQGNCVQCNDDAQCGTDEVCAANTCVGDPDLFCNENLCLTNETARANCIEAYLTCVALEPANEDECVLAGLAQCNLECLEDNDCEVDEVCTNNECVADVMCMMDSDCDDENQCTVDTCIAGECSNPNQEAGATCDQDGGSVCDGNGACVECTMNDDCGVDEICQDNACVSDPNVFCDTGICATDDAARDACVDAFLTCILLDGVSEEECIALSLAECNECNDNNECGDGLECTADLCIDGECSNPPVMDGMMCDDMTGTCNAGDCVPDALALYAQDFEPPMDPLDPDALIFDTAAEVPLGPWIVFANVFNDVGGLKFNFGPFGAPNATVSPSDTFISAVVTGEGDTPQGDQQLSVFSDYNCCDRDIISGELQQGHGNGTDRVQINVFQELNPIPGSLIGQTLTFSFDAKRGNIEGATTALAFITTLDPTTGFSQTNFVEIDLTGVSASWQRYSITLDLTDPALVGQVLQFGFRNTAQDFEGSGIFYDNVDASLTPTP